MRVKFGRLEEGTPFWSGWKLYEKQSYISVETQSRVSGGYPIFKDPQTNTREMRYFAPDAIVEKANTDLICKIIRKHARESHLSSLTRKTYAGKIH